MPDVRPVEAVKAGIYLKQGRLGQAQEWAREQGLAVNDDLDYENEFEHLTLARVLLAKYTETGAGRALQQAARRLDRAGAKNLIHRNAAARTLGVGRSTLYRQMEKLGIAGKVEGHLT